MSSVVEEFRCDEQMESDEEMVEAPARRGAQEVFEDPPSSPSGSDSDSNEDDAPPLPPSPVRPPEPEGPPPEDDVIDRAASTAQSSTSLIYGYGITPRDPRVQTRSFNINVRAPNQQVVAPTQRAAQSARNAPFSGMWLTPTTSDTQVLSGADLPRRSGRPESVFYGIDDVEPANLAYPYARRYARETMGVLPHALYETLELPQRGLHRYLATGEEEYALHPLMLSILVNADWRMRAAFDWPTEPPVYPSAVPYRNIDSVFNNATDMRLSIAPMFRPEAPNIEYASLNRWLPVQRGLLLSMEELVRHALHTHSATLHAWEMLHVLDQRPSEAPGLLSAFDLLVAQQANVLVELLHHVVYCHRHAYVRTSPDWLRNQVLGQPIFGQRRLFTMPTSLPQ